MYSDITKNKIKTWFIVIGFVGMISLIVYALYYAFDLSEWVIIWAVVAASISAVVSYYNCDKMILRSVHARPATHSEDQKLTNIFESLMLTTGLKNKPKLYVVDSEQPNAFATGRNPEHSVVCVTTALLDRLDYYELEGVVAHELAHVKNYDILLSSVISVLVGFVLILSDTLSRYWFFLGDRNSRNRKSSNNSKSSGDGIVQAVLLIVGMVLLILSPIVSKIIQLAVSRRREYLADATAIKFTRNPQGLISALRKLDSDQHETNSSTKGIDHMCIVSPLKSRNNQKRSNLFSTHPSVEERVAAISKLK